MVKAGRLAGFAPSIIVLNGGAFWTVPELLFESNKLIPALQQLLNLQSYIGALWI